MSGGAAAAWSAGGEASPAEWPGASSRRPEKVPNMTSISSRRGPRSSPAPCGQQGQGLIPAYPGQSLPTPRSRRMSSMRQ
eukprot:15811505-Heterocapsa_arctica.AAC.1